jgi:hypothetical protein
MFKGYEEYAKQGNAFCSKCGVRAESKNIMSRSVFPLMPPLLEVWEAGLLAHKHDDQDFFGLKDPEVNRDLASHLIRYLKCTDNDVEGLRVLLCVHRWQHDEGFVPVIF